MVSFTKVAATATGLAFTEPIAASIANLTTTSYLAVAVLVLGSFAKVLQL